MTIFEVIKKYEEDGDFTHYEVSEDIIDDMEKQLQLKLPKEYVDFLRLFGHGGLVGFEVLGVGKNGNYVFCNVTIRYRKIGLPNELIVIEDCDEWVYCIDTKDNTVVMWAQDENIKVAYDSFMDYLSDRVQDALENNY